MKKIFSALFSALIFLFLIPTANAQQPSSFPTHISPTPISTVSQTNVGKTAYPLEIDSNVPQNFHTYSQNVFIEILASLSCILTGYDPLTSSGKCLGINTITNKIGYVDGGQGGAIGILGNMIGMTFNIPVSSSTYVRYLASNFGVTKTGIAAEANVDDGNNVNNNFSNGYGYAGLKPLLNLWILFRNIVYLVFVLIFIIIGLGIMLRVNVDARSVMSIQNQIPKIIIGIILVTFSYAIAGFIVDMMYVLMYLVYYLFYSFTAQNGLDLGRLNPSSLQGSTPFSTIGGLFSFNNLVSGASGPFGHIIASLFDNTLGKVLASIVGGLIGGGIGSFGGIVGSAAGGLIGAVGGFVAGGKILGIVGGLVAYIVIAVAILWSMFRLWFLLLKSYIFFMIDVIFAPFWIGLGLIPKGDIAGFGSWIKDTIANLAVFPATLFMLLLGKIIILQFTSNTEASFVPPLIGNPGDIENFASIIGVGIILLLPGVVTIVRDTLKAPGFKYTQQIAQGIGTGQKLAGVTFGKTKEALWYTNKDGSPARLKNLYFNSFKKAQNWKVNKAISSSIAGAGSKMPFVSKIVQNKRLKNAVDAEIERLKNSNGIKGDDQANLQYRAGGVNPTTNRFEGYVGSFKAWENPHNGTVTIDTPFGQIELPAKDVYWNRI